MADPGPWSPPLPPPTPVEALPPPQPQVLQPAALERERRVRDQDPPAEPARPRSPVPADRRRGGIWWLVGLLLVAAVIGGIIIARQDKPPTTSSPPTTLDVASSAEPSVVDVTAAVPSPVVDAPQPTLPVPSDPSATDSTAAVSLPVPTEPIAVTSPTVPSEPTAESATVWPNGVVLTVATSAGSRLVSGLGETPLSLAGGDNAISFPDGPGIGVMYQAGQFASGSTDPTDIWRVRPDGRQIILYPARRGEDLRLHDVRVVNGRPEVLYSIRRPSGGELLYLARPVEASTIELVELSNGETSTSRLRFGGDFIVGESSSGGYKRLFSVTTSGRPGLDQATYGILEPALDECYECPRHFAINSAGTQLGWIAAGQLVIVDRVTGAESARVALPETLGGSDVLFDDLQIGDGVAVVNVYSGDNSPTSATVIDYRGPAATFVESPLAGYADLV